MAGYNAYYIVENLFGEPYPELINYMDQQKRGKVLDLGCGQGRDAIALARMEFEVMGIDSSKVGVDQMVQVASREKLPLIGQVADIFAYNEIDSYDYIILDSMFHFAKGGKKKETSFISRIIGEMKSSAQLIVCIQDTGKKVGILKETISNSDAEIAFESQFVYQFEDKESGHQSKTNYQMIVAVVTRA